MSRTVQERLRAALESGELADCATWQDVLHKLQAADRVVRTLRKTSNIGKTDNSIGKSISLNSTNEIDVDVSEFAEEHIE